MYISYSSISLICLMPAKNAAAPANFRHHFLLWHCNAIHIHHLLANKPKAFESEADIHGFGGIILSSSNSHRHNINFIRNMLMSNKFIENSKQSNDAEILQIHILIIRNQIK